MANPALIAKAAAIILTDEKARKAVGWTLVAILSPLILLIAFLCALGSGATEHNITAVELCFYDTIGIPAETPEEYRLCIEAMRTSFAQLDIAIAAINENTEEETSLDDIRVKAIFYALYFGAESHRDAQSFADCVSARFSWRAATRRRRRRRPTLWPFPSRIWELSGRTSPPWVWRLPLSSGATPTASIT